MKGSSKFIIVLCLLIALASMTLAFYPMFKNITSEQSETESSDIGDDVSSDVSGDDVSSDVPGDGSSSELPDSDVPSDSSDSGSSEDESDSGDVPDVSGYTVTIYAQRSTSSYGDLVISYTNSAGETVSNTYTNPGEIGDDGYSPTGYTTIILEDVASSIFLDFTSMGFIKVCYENGEVYFDGSSVGDGFTTFYVEEDVTLYVYGIYS